MKLTLCRKLTTCQAYAKARVAYYLFSEESKRKANEEQTSKRSRIVVSKYTVDKEWKEHIEYLLEELVGQVGNLVDVVNQIRDKLKKLGEYLRRLGFKLITQAEIVRAEMKTEKKEKRKNKEKKKAKRKWKQTVWRWR